MNNFEKERLEMQEWMEKGHPFPWAIFYSDDALMEKAETDEKFLEDVLVQFQEEHSTFGDIRQDMRKLIAIYRNCPKEHRMTIDAVFCALTGWSLPTLVFQTEIPGEEIPASEDEPGKDM